MRRGSRATDRVQKQTISALRSPLRSFPVAAVTNHHRRSGLGQQKFIVSLLCGPEVQDHGVGRDVSLWRLRGGTHSLALSQLLVAACSPGILGS